MPQRKKSFRKICQTHLSILNNPQGIGGFHGLNKIEIERDFTTPPSHQGFCTKFKVRLSLLNQEVERALTFDKYCHTRLIAGNFFFLNELASMFPRTVAASSCLLVDKTMLKKHLWLRRCMAFLITRMSYMILIKSVWTI